MDQLHKSAVTRRLPTGVCAQIQSSVVWNEGILGCICKWHCTMVSWDGRLQDFRGMSLKALDSVCVCVCVCVCSFLKGHVFFLAYSFARKQIILYKSLYIVDFEVDFKVLFIVLLPCVGFQNKHPVLHCMPPSYLRTFYFFLHTANWTGLIWGLDDMSENISVGSVLRNTLRSC